MNKNLLRGAYVAAMSGGLLLLANTAAHADTEKKDAKPVQGKDLIKTAAADANNRFIHPTGAKGEGPDKTTEVPPVARSACYLAGAGSVPSAGVAG
ncbi:MAG: hypothetical protein ABS81_26835 [Pseudonocardia sp. SCN 72-86]|nr:MAG: hypothetical protein ABS81_26835 [Pseudonocardia sp. SCN 72-86]